MERQERRGNVASGRCRVVFKNVQKCSSVQKQRELITGLEKGGVDICGVVETGLLWNEFVEGGKNFQFFGKNRPGDHRRGGVGFVVKAGLEVEVILEETDLMGIRLLCSEGLSLYFFVCYQRCEGEDLEENRGRLGILHHSVTSLGRDAMVFIGGDFNGHLLELDLVENSNGRLVKEVCGRLDLILLNGVRPELNSHTWERGPSKYTLDLVLVSERALGYIDEAWLTPWEEPVESDHRGLGFSVRMYLMKEKKVRKINRKLPSEAWTSRKDDPSQLSFRVEEKVKEGNIEVIPAVLQTVDDLFSELTRGRKASTSRDWWDEEVEAAISLRKTRNRERRRLERSGSEEEKQEAWRGYVEAKERAKELVARKIHAYNQKLFAEMGGGRQRSQAVFKQLEFYLSRGLKRSGRSLILTGSNGEEMSRREDLEAMLLDWWGDLLNEPGTAVCNIPKMCHEMTQGDRRISRLDFERAVKKLRNGKAKDEEGVIAEYLKGLGPVAMEQLREELNTILESGIIPKDWKESRVNLHFKGGDPRMLANYRPVTITSVAYKLMMYVLQERVDRWAEENNLFGEFQGGFRQKRSADDNLFILERLTEMSNARGDQLLLAFIDLEKAYDRVDRKKLLDVLEKRGMSPGLVNLLAEVYSGDRVKFVLKDVETPFIEVTAGVRQGCPLSPSLFNIYMRDVEDQFHVEGEGFKCHVREDGVLKEEWISGLLYADDICVIARSDQELQRILVRLESVFGEYGMKVSFRKSSIIRVGRECEVKQWRIQGGEIEEKSEAKYLGFMLRGGKEGGFVTLGSRMNAVRQTTGMVKFAAKHSGSRFVVGREGWKSVVVSKVMYGAGALVWDREERNRLEKLQNDFGRWLWKVQMSVRNGCVRGESGWSSFEEREMKAKLAFVCKILRGNSVVSQVGRACLLELGRKSPWWRVVEGFFDVLDLECLWHLVRCRRMSALDGVQLGFDADWTEDVCKVVLDDKVKEYGKKMWSRSLSSTARTREYTEQKGEIRIESYADGSEGAKVRMMVRGDSLLVRCNPNVAWKYGELAAEKKCECGEDETEEHVLFECQLYEDRRVEWRRVWSLYQGNADLMTGVLGYIRIPLEVERVLLKAIGGIWRDRERREKRRIAQ